MYAGEGAPLITRQLRLDWFLMFLVRDYLFAKKKTSTDEEVPSKVRLSPFHSLFSFATLLMLSISKCCVVLTVD
jgi:hypothetical protein